ncbi:MscL family protein [Phycicoccus sp. BSK3Z-2]|uniref:MscL family protein n=1 Tax=Phycicoccus avicenniae TaxID=2828860 RepID=A0A941DEH6_9MICO|nr:MscL family protein [Phycicoccus avicenniae]MBR7744837.1 MscL family protein [Phycicoccus avicenniae]
MQGFKAFIMRGNLVELAVAFIIGAAFATVVSAFTAIIVEALAKAGGAPNFDEWQPGGFTSVGPFLTALVAFLLMAFIVYFFVVRPYEVAKARMFPAEPVTETIDPNTELLREIRDELRTGRGV